MEALLDACLASDHAAAAEHIVYRGEDPARRWRTSVQIDNPAEAETVSQVCGRLRALLGPSGAHEKLDYEQSEQSEGSWHVWHVAFGTGSGQATRVLAFLEVDGRYLLGDID